MKIKTLAIFSLPLLFTLCATHALAENPPQAFLPGLVAHYYQDPLNWNGHWADKQSEPSSSSSDWTFTEYQYSRVEPVINHLFIRRGWFSVRWTGWLDVDSAIAAAGGSLEGQINLNPNNADETEFVLTLPDGSTLTRDNLKSTYAGYSGDARHIRLKPKGNSNQNSLTLDGAPYPIQNGRIYDISAEEMHVRLYNDRITENARAMGKWWIDITAGKAIIIATDDSVTKPPSKPSDPAPEYWFQIKADDGCRLFIDNKKVIDDWRPCSENSPSSLRKAEPIRLSSGKHTLVVEYFQGQSLQDNDHDPMTVYWACPDRKLDTQIIPAGAFSHTTANTQSSSR